MKNIKIVFTDLDYTLTKSEGKIDIVNKRIFEKLADIGIPVVINTGRFIPYLVPICKQFSTSNYLIASNGAEIYNYLNNKMIYRSVISKENIKYLNEIINKHNLLYTAYGVLKKYTNKDDENHKLYYCKNLIDINDEIAQVVIQSYDVNLMIEAKRDLLKNDTLKIINKSPKVEEGILLYYDIVNSEVSKGNALIKLCEYLNIDPKRSMAIGDSGNDLDMLKAAGYKVAVANATEEIKKIADVVVPSNIENGVATILNELFNQKIN